MRPAKTNSSRITNPKSQIQNATACLSYSNCSQVNTGKHLRHLRLTLPRGGLILARRPNPVGRHPIGPGSTWHSLNESSIRPNLDSRNFRPCDRELQCCSLPVSECRFPCTVVSRGPAQRSGVLEGDVIVGYGDQPISGIDQLHRVLTENQVGLRSSLTVIRKGERRVLPIVPEESHIHLPRS